MIIERSVPLLKLAAAAGAAALGVWLVKKLKAPAPAKHREKTVIGERVEVRSACDVPWGVDV